jgi:hypothetical protein
VHGPRVTPWNVRAIISVDRSMTARALAIVAMLAMPAIADTDVNCFRLAPWAADHGDYRQGDQVWARVAMAVEPHAYECRWHLCPTKYGLDTPEAFRRWKDLGACMK